MPLKTFYNLPPDKRDKLMDAIREEFSRVPCSEVSINRIIKTAGISRGSFYQYFEDKEDLLDYLFSEYKGQLFARSVECLQANGGDLLGMFTDMLDFTHQYITEGKRNYFFRNLLADVRVSSIMFDGKNRLDRDEGLEEIAEIWSPYLNWEQLDIRSHEEFLTMLRTLFPLATNAFAEAFLDIDRFDTVRAQYTARLALLGRGYLKSKEPSLYQSEVS